jgi:hypothetical protein
VYFLFFNKREGGKCNLEDKDDEDKNGIYKYDEDLDCVLDSCKKGYEVSGTSCIKERKAGDSCKGSDSRGTYKLDSNKICKLQSCSTGYKVENGKCVSTTPVKTASRPYPPKPYPNTTAITNVENVYEWTVDSSAGYGEGKYKVDVSGSLLTNPAYDGSLDAGGLFDKGVGAPLSYVGDEHSYHSPSGGGVAWFHFYLPKYITLDKLDIYPRGHSDDEMTNMQNSVWNIYGIDRSSGSAAQTTLYSSGSGGVTFTKGQIKSLIIPDNAKTKKYKEFKVDFDPAGTNYIVFNELLFYGSNESDSA